MPRLFFCAKSENSVPIFQNSDRKNSVFWPKTQIKSRKKTQLYYINFFAKSVFSPKTQLKNAKTQFFRNFNGVNVVTCAQKKSLPWVSASVRPAVSAAFWWPRTAASSDPRGASFPGRPGGLPVLGSPCGGREKPAAGFRQTSASMGSGQTWNVAQMLSGSASLSVGSCGIQTMA